MNEFRHLSIRDRSLDRSQAELWVLADATTVDARTEIRGRLVGPTCPYATTIEVAYPLRPFRQMPEGLPPLTRRVVIPDPSFWDPISPFLYRGMIELWQDGEVCAARELRHGLRSVQMGSFGLIWNGQELRLSAVQRANVPTAELPALHRLGVNALVLPLNAEAQWREAEQLGFVVIGVVADPNAVMPLSAQSPACLGWLLPHGWWTERERWQGWIATAQKWRHFIGVELAISVDLTKWALPPEVTFVIGPYDLPPIGRPRLLRPRPDALPVDEPELGWLSP